MMINDDLINITDVDDYMLLGQQIMLIRNEKLSRLCTQHKVP